MVTFVLIGGFENMSNTLNWLVNVKIIQRLQIGKTKKFKAKMLLTPL